MSRALFAVTIAGCFHLAACEVPPQTAPGPAPAPAPGGGAAADTTMSFFVTSRGKGTGGNLGGLAGADAHCKALATAVSPQLGLKDWKAYLSTSTVNAYTRIGNGPWYNARGILVAPSSQVLHQGQAADGELTRSWPLGPAAWPVVLDEKGEQHVNAVHDILTGTNMAGLVDGTNTCADWTSTEGQGTVGHSNRAGGGRAPSWNQTHQVGCGPELNAMGAPQNQIMGTVTSGGGRGSFYCFAVR